MPFGRLPHFPRHLPSLGSVSRVTARQPEKTARITWPTVWPIRALLLAPWRHLAPDPVEIIWSAAREKGERERTVLNLEHVTGLASVWVPSPILGERWPGCQWNGWNGTTWPSLFTLGAICRRGFPKVPHCQLFNKLNCILGGFCLKKCVPWNSLSL